MTISVLQTMAALRWPAARHRQRNRHYRTNRRHSRWLRLFCRLGR